MEQIYTIPINEHFDASMRDPSAGCPVCSLCRMLEENEIDLILGASMMEPDVRIKTNKEGFCQIHSGIMFTRKNRLGMALTLESHLNELRSEVADLPLLVPGSRARHRVGELEGSCYVCRRISSNYTHMIENLIYIWENDPDFRVKFSSQPYFCLPHWKAMLEAAKIRLGRKMNAEFAKAAADVVLPYFDSLREDISWFCKKFDYRYSEEPWGNSKDSVERANKFLRGDVHIR
ncbi:MAG: hypothetical protein J5919_02025 [Clostridia bacterium]|nr:hypothetical protein [Clostridia bacterium]MBP5173594.1 hypothetical protein [Clostridia bacterium]